MYSDALAISENSIQIECKKDTHDWVLDSGCSFHMTPLKGWFTTYKVWNESLVYMGNDNACKIIGIGFVTLKFKNGTTTLLRNVRHVPSLKRNLISFGMLDSIGCQYKGST